MVEYKPPLSGRHEKGLTLLDFNERTIPLPQKVLEKLSQWCLSGVTHRYPEYSGLIDAIADYTKCATEKILVGNGSDQLLDCVFRAVVAENDRVLIPTPSFSMYRQCAGLVGAQVDSYDLLSGDPVDALKKSLKLPPRLVVIANPNNPTGTLMDPASLHGFFKKYEKTWFLVDEAYFEFSGRSVLEADDFPTNLIVCRTFSKAFGLAALRVGYMVAHEDTIVQILKIRGPYDVNQLAVVAAKAVLEDREDVLAYAREIMSAHKKRVESCLKDKGLEFLSSEANFFLLTSPPEGLTEYLMQSGLRVRPVKLSEGKAALRISIGDGKATDLLITLLNKF